MKKPLLFDLWIVGLLSTSVLLSTQVSWRLGLLFLLLFAAPAWGYSKWHILKRLDLLLLILLTTTIVISTFQITHSMGYLTIWVTGLLFLGTIRFIFGLLRLGWVRPVGGIVDSFVIIFCTLFPLSVLLLQWFVKKHFDLFPTQVNIQVLLFQMLAVLIVYSILTQKVSADIDFSNRMIPFFKICTLLILFIFGFRFISLGKHFLELRQLEFEQGSTFQQIYKEADRLDMRNIKAKLAVKGSQNLLRFSTVGQFPAGPKAIQLLSKVRSNLLPPGFSNTDQFLDSLDNKAISVLFLGSQESLMNTEKSFKTFAIDFNQVILYLASTQNILFRVGAQEVSTVSLENIPKEKSPIQDLLWLEKEKLLVVLHENGKVRWLQIQEIIISEKPYYKAVLQQEQKVQYSSPARKLQWIPNSQCLLLAFGDFRCIPIQGKPSEYLNLENREYCNGQDLLRDICFLESGEGGYILDTYGGVHPFGKTPISYQDLSEHSKQKLHYWPNNKFACSLHCSLDGRSLLYTDSFGGVHGIELLNDFGSSLHNNENILYYGSPRAFYSQPVIVKTIQAYNSLYLLHRDGQIERRPGLSQLKRKFLLQQSSFKSSILLTTSGFGILWIVSWILFRSPRRIPIL